MATFEDLTPLSYFGAEYSDVLRGVGWLGRDSEYRKGPMAVEVYERLQKLLSRPFQPILSAGFHECELCQFDGVPGSANLFVPGDGFLYVSPELIGHYVNVHGYRPPDEFCVAVMECPDTHSIDYKKLFLKNGGRRLLAP